MKTVFLSRIVFLSAITFIFLIGFFSYQSPDLFRRPAFINQFYNQNVRFRGIVVSEPDRSDNKARVIVQVENSQDKVLLTVYPYPQYQYGDILDVEGKLREPWDFDGFDYKGYLAKDGIWAVVYFPKVELVGRDNRGSLQSAIFPRILRLKENFRKVVRENLSPPQSSVLAAMVLGDKRRMSDELKEILNLTGLRHITAISGMHIAILSGMMMNFFTSLGLWKKQAFYLVLGILAVFVIMIGMPSSAVRAGIFSSALLLGEVLGRPRSSSRTIVFAAALMLIHNPLLLRYDAGFQLSFLAVIGIVYLKPYFQNLLRIVPEESFFNFRSILAMTISAQVFTFPILLYNFGQVSLVALITNALILPILPFVFGLGLFFGLAGIIWDFLGWLLSLPLWFLLTYITSIAELFSKLPLAALRIENLHPIWLFLFYIALGFFVWKTAGRREPVI